MGTAMFLNATAKIPSWLRGSQRKGINTGWTKGTKSLMTTFRIKELESLGFEWGRYDATWEDRLSELANYRKMHGHCVVPHNYSDIKLANWILTQRQEYTLHVKGKTTHMTTFRIKELESLGFEWKPSLSRWRATPNKASLDDDSTRVRKRVVESPEYIQRNISPIKKSSSIKATSHSNTKNPTGVPKFTSASSRVEPKSGKSVEVGDARFDETDLDGSPSELAVKPNLYSDRQAARLRLNEATTLLVHQFGSQTIGNGVLNVLFRNIRLDTLVKGNLEDCGRKMRSVK
jgi:hypothetical protein